MAASPVQRSAACGCRARSSACSSAEASRSPGRADPRARPWHRGRPPGTCPAQRSPVSGRPADRGTRGRPRPRASPRDLGQRGRGWLDPRRPPAQARRKEREWRLARKATRSARPGADRQPRIRCRGCGPTPPAGPPRPARAAAAPRRLRATRGRSSIGSAGPRCQPSLDRTPAVYGIAFVAAMAKSMVSSFFTFTTPATVTGLIPYSVWRSRRRPLAFSVVPGRPRRATARPRRESRRGERGRR